MGFDYGEYEIMKNQTYSDFEKLVLEDIEKDMGEELFEARCLDNNMWSEGEEHVKEVYQKFWENHLD